MSMRICVIGVGGVGGYFGGRLAAAGNSVAFVARGATLNALNSDGLHIESPLGNLHLAEIEATDDPTVVGEVDAVVLGVKAWQVPEVAEEARSLVGPDTVILPLQNGVEATDQLIATYGAGPVLGGFCWIVAAATAPGRIHHLGVEPQVALGELDNRRTERVERLAGAFADAGVTVEIPINIHAALWKKFLFIASISGVGAVARASADELRSHPGSRGLLRQAMEEIADLAAARCVILPFDVVDRTMDFVDSLPDDAMASMQRDIMDGRPSELDSLNGAVVRYGRESVVPVPVHRFIHAALAPSEWRVRKPSGTR